MSAPQDIKEYVAACLPNSFQHTLISYIGDPQSFHVAIAATVSSKSEFASWLEEFKEASKTEWNVARTNSHIEANPKARLVCHLEYECCHSVKNKSRAPNSVELRTVKNQACPAKMDVKIKKASHYAKQSDSLLAAGYACTIQLGFNHSHTIDNSRILAFRRAPAQLKEYFFQLFSEDNTPAAAMRIVLQKLKLRDDYDSGMSADAALYPKPQTVYYWYRLWRLSTQGDQDGPAMWQLLDQRVANLAASGTTVLYQAAEGCKQMAIAIVTPLMRRAHDLPSAKDIVFVDSTATCDDSNHVITFMLTSSPVGAVPLGVIISTGQSSLAYEAGFKLLKEAIGESAFTGQPFPKFLIRHDSKAEGEGFARAWPGTTQLLCIFHVLQAHWRYLWSAEKGIRGEHRQDLMRLFKLIVDSRDETDAEAHFRAAVSSAVAEHYPDYIEYVIGMWERKAEWSKAFRMFVPELRGHHTNNYSEASIRLFKDLILSRCKAFNSLALVDYIASAMEEYYEKRLLEFAHGRNNKTHIFFMQLLAKAKGIPAENVWAYPNSTTDFQVRSATEEGVIYDVNNEVGMCSCYEGCFGKFCKHQAAVWKYFGNAAPNMPAVQNEDYYKIAVLALGSKAREPSYYALPSDVQFSACASNAEMEESFAVTAAAEEMPPCSSSSEGLPRHYPQQKVCFDLSKFRETWERMGAMIEANIHSDSLQRCVKKLISAEKHLQNESQLQSMVVAMAKSISTRHKHGKRIGVQPASACRRAEKKTRGPRRQKEGRPLKSAEQIVAQQLIKKAKKRRQNFSYRCKANKR